MGLYSWGELWDDYTTYQKYMIPGSPSQAGALFESVAQLMPESVSKGTIFGTGFGEEATDYWAQQYNQTPGEWYSDGEKFSCGTMGLLASSWTEENWTATATTLTGAYGIRNAFRTWLMGDQVNRAYTLIDYGNLFRLERHMLGTEKTGRAVKWHIDALGKLLKHWPW